MVDKKKCPDCGDSTHFVKNGYTLRGVQIYRCKMCGRKFVAHPAGRVPDVIEGIIFRMLHAGFSVKVISEITLVSRGAIYTRKRKQKND